MARRENVENFVEEISGKVFRFWFLKNHFREFAVNLLGRKNMYFIANCEVLYMMSRLKVT